MGDVIDLAKFRRRKAREKRDELPPLFRGGMSKLEQALAKYGSHNGTKTLEKKRAWMKKKDDEDGDDFGYFD